MEVAQKKSLVEQYNKPLQNEFRREEYHTILSLRCYRLKGLRLLSNSFLSAVY